MRERRQQELKLAGGLMLCCEDFPTGRSRAFKLLIKGLLVYLVVMGTLGCFLSALQIDYHQAVVHLTVLLSAFFCAFLYYRKSWENIGYLLYIFLLLVFVFLFRTYINSGFYSVINALSEEASEYFGSNAARSYGEQVGNEKLAVTLAFCFVGSVLCVMTNISVSRKMNYVDVLVAALAVLLAPLYLELSPSVGYVLLLFIGVLSVYVFRRAGHYQPTNNNMCYKYRGRRKKRKLSYVYAHRAEAEALLFVTALTLALLLAGEALLTKSMRSPGKETSGLKAMTRDSVENFTMFGFMGLMNFYQNTGGLKSGRLGGVSSVRLDYNTDLEITFAPYSYDRIYLRSYIGDTYLPYENCWMRAAMPEEMQKTSGGGTQNPADNPATTSERLSGLYAAGSPYAARGRMLVKNVAAPIGTYSPYYSERDVLLYPDDTGQYVYYPLFAETVPELAQAQAGNGMAFGGESGAVQTASGPDGEDMSVYLTVPAGNQETLDAFCEEAGLNGSAEEIILQLRDYFQEEVPYTLQPGITPRNEDFINYFLTRNRKGYCAHFASAATLILRNMGIPARYVEGYAVDTADMTERGEQAEEEKYEDYYDGYTPIGITGVITVEATDADSHAWVEVYHEDTGWYVVELTPYSGENEGRENDIWSLFMRFLNGEDAGEQTEERGTGAASGFARAAGRALFYVLGILLLLFAVLYAGRQLYFRALKLWRYHRAGRNERLLLDYRGFLSKLGRKEKDILLKVNYRQEVGWLAAHQYCPADEDREKECVRILNKAAFSDKTLTEEEDRRVREYLKL